MNDDYILDYEQVLKKLDNLHKRTCITKEKDIGVTKYGLPINCYSVGKGNKVIVVTGATHGSEIVSTDFILKLMENLSDGKEKFLNNFKICFIPMLNPEGYLITTSAIRAKIPRNASIEMQEQFARKYYLAYKNDDILGLNRKKRGEETDRTSIKTHQEIFSDISAECISNKYKKIKDRVSKILEKYNDIPKGSLAIWSANADGIDLQANSKYNPVINRIKKGETVYKDDLRYSNIKISHPGPINCPFDVDKGFEYTNEVIAINNFLKELKEKNKLYAFYNFHSTGGIIYQRPIQSNLNKEELSQKTIENYFFSKIYSGKPKENYPLYRIEKKEGKRTSTNDFFRIIYPIDLLIELSAMGGNPIGPYGDKDGNYQKTIDSNIKAFKSSMKVFEISKMLSEEINNKFSKLINTVSKDINTKTNTDCDKNVMNTYDAIDLIYDEFYKKIKDLKDKDTSSQVSTNNTTKKINESDERYNGDER